MTEAGGVMLLQLASTTEATEKFRNIMEREAFCLTELNKVLFHSIKEVIQILLEQSDSKNTQRPTIRL